MEQLGVDAEPIDVVAERLWGTADLDFLKVDTQGTELEVLEGAKESLASPAAGVQVESAFAEIYRGQAEFCDIHRFMRDRGFLLCDLKRIFWKRCSREDLPGEKGQLGPVDGLYFRDPSTFLDAASSRAILSPKAVNYVRACLAYGYLDLGRSLVREASSELDGDLSRRLDRLIHEVARGNDAGARGILSRIGSSLLRWSGHSEYRVVKGRRIDRRLGNH